VSKRPTPDKTRQIHLRYTVLIPDLYLPEGPDSQELDIGGEYKLRLELHQPSKPFRGQRPIAVRTVMFGVWPCSRKAAAGFEAIAEGRIPDGSVPPSEWQSWDRVGPGRQTLVDDRGRIVLEDHMPFQGYLPRAMQNEIYRLESEIRSSMDRAIGLLRWRLNLSSSSRLSQAEQPEWSINGSSWRPLLEATGRFSLPVELREVVLDGAACRDVASLMNEGTHLPVGYELFYEAWALRETSPRSALIMAVAAAEVSTKRFIAELAPDTTWLVVKNPAPYLDKLLRDFLPSLMHASGRGFDLDEQILETITNAVTERNRLIHQGEYKLEHHQLCERLTAVHSLLLFIDRQSGRGWATGNAPFQELSWSK
jgi:hypothetical protein